MKYGYIYNRECGYLTYGLMSRPCMALYDSIWSLVALYIGHAWPCVILYGHCICGLLWSHIMIICGHVWCWVATWKVCFHPVVFCINSIVDVVVKWNIDVWWRGQIALVETVEETLVCNWEELRETSWNLGQHFLKGVIPEPYDLPPQDRLARESVCIVLNTKLLWGFRW